MLEVAEDNTEAGVESNKVLCKLTRKVELNVVYSQKQHRGTRCVDRNRPGNIAHGSRCHTAAPKPPPKPEAGLCRHLRTRDTVA